MSSERLSKVPSNHYSDELEYLRTFNISDNVFKQNYKPHKHNFIILCYTKLITLHQHNYIMLNVTLLNYTVILHYSILNYANNYVICDMLH